MSSSKKCESCAKTVYPLEALSVGEMMFHKGCFKCVTCGLRLTVEKYILKEGKIYCPKCVPQVKQVGTTVTWEIENAKKGEALKKDTVSAGIKTNVYAGGGERGTQAVGGFLDEQHKKNATMLADANKIRSVVITGDRGTQAGIDMVTDRAMKLTLENKDLAAKSGNVRGVAGMKPSTGGTGYEFGASSPSGASHEESSNAPAASEEQSQPQEQEAPAPAAAEEQAAPQEEQPSQDAPQEEAPQQEAPVEEPAQE